MSYIASAFLTPFLWPLPHIVTSLRLKGSEPPPILTAPSHYNLAGNLSACGGALRSFLIAVCLVYGLHGGESYPAFGRAETFAVSWMWPILLRNIVGTWLICGLWDWWLYFGPLRDKFFKYKIVPKYPSMVQMRHDMLYTTFSSVFAALLEILLCHWYASGTAPMCRSLGDKPLLHATLALSITHWRVPHFWLTHRVMHPWRIERVPDVGKWLYRAVHALHHKSYNITAFSGTNMHPCEATLYFSAAFICVPLGVHPCIALGCFVDLAMGAWIGHDGHVFPGGGNYFHTLHHMHFDCNYGAPHVPIDKWMGTYAGSKEEVARIWGKKPSGREANANDTAVQCDSTSDKVE